MKEITTFDELCLLPAGTKIHYYQFGNHTPYVIIGINPNFKHYPLLYAYNGGDVTKVTAFSERHFRTSNNKIFVGYEPKTAGEVMISQLNEQVESIKNMYIKN